MTRLEAAHLEFDRLSTDLLQSLHEHDALERQCHERYMASQVELREALEQLWEKVK